MGGGRAQDELASVVSMNSFYYSPEPEPIIRLPVMIYYNTSLVYVSIIHVFYEKSRTIHYKSDNYRQKPQFHTQNCKNDCLTRQLW